MHNDVEDILFVQQISTSVQNIKQLNKNRKVVTHQMQLIFSLDRWRKHHFLSYLTKQTSKQVPYNCLTAKFFKVNPRQFSVAILVIRLITNPDLQAIKSGMG